jgi:hypothetical protein
LSRQITSDAGEKLQYVSRALCSYEITTGNPQFGYMTKVDGHAARMRGEKRVKFALEQAMKAQRWSKGKALLFL